MLENGGTGSACRWAALAQLRFSSLKHSQMPTAVLLPCNAFGGALTKGVVTDFDLRRTILSAQATKVVGFSVGYLPGLAVAAMPVPGTSFLLKSVLCSNAGAEHFITCRQKILL